MFFQQPAAEPPDPPHPDLPEWVGPSKDDRGTVVATELLLARSAHVAVVLPHVIAYPTGCLLTVEVVIRKGDLSHDDWWDLATSATDATMPGRRWDRVLRFGLQYPDGTKVTNLDPTVGRRPDTAETTTPVGPLLSWTPTGGGGGLRHHTSHVSLWLWPLPPAEPLTVAVEWPLGGIELTTVELDGAELVAAAERSTRYWPDN